MDHRRDKTVVAEKPSVSVDQFDTRSVVRKLEELMTRVTKFDCSAETVNAACNCAGRIVDILRVHLEFDRHQKAFYKNNKS